MTWPRRICEILVNRPENDICYLRLHCHVLQGIFFIMEANTMNSDSTAPNEHSDLGPYCLQYRLPKKGNRKLVTVGKNKKNHEDFYLFH